MQDEVNQESEQNEVDGTKKDLAAVWDNLKSYPVTSEENDR